jgi:plastocyanin
MRTRLLLVASISFVGVAALAVFACSSDSTQPLPGYNADASDDSPPPPANDAAKDVATSDATNDAPSDAPFDTGSDSAVDAGPDGAILMNNCSAIDFAATDRSAPSADRTVHFPFDASPGMYDPPCMRIKVGESVKWVGNFQGHPLYGNDNNPNNPIPNFSGDGGGPDGGVSVPFAEAGVFGYACQVHGSMQGAIDVEP